MNPFLAEAYHTRNNIRGLVHLSRLMEKRAGFVDAAMDRAGIGPGKSTLMDILFGIASRATSWPLRDSTEFLKGAPWLNTLQRLEKGPRVYTEAMEGLQNLISGGPVGQAVVPGYGPIGGGG